MLLPNQPKRKCSCSKMLLIDQLFIKVWSHQCPLWLHSWIFRYLQSIVCNCVTIFEKFWPQWMLVWESWPQDPWWNCSHSLSKLKFSCTNSLIFPNRHFSLSPQAFVSQSHTWGKTHKSVSLILIKIMFSNYSCMFLNPNIFFQFEL